jgi:ribosomal-protein-alanine N-acetyltransferase
MGYDLAAPHRRQGIMTEAMEAAIDYGFGSMGLNRIEALVDPGNTASIRLLLRLGFSQEGVLREYTHFRGKFVDDVCFSLLRREWRARGQRRGPP